MGPAVITIPRMSSIPDFMRTHPSLPPVQEEASSEDASDDEATKKPGLTAARRRFRRAPATPDLKRDSGFGLDSPHTSGRRQAANYEHGNDSIRDSGVELEGTPSMTSRGIEQEQKHEHNEERSSLTQPQPQPQSPPSGSSKTRLGQGAPRFREPSPPPRTPEPEKLAVKKRRAPVEEEATGAPIAPIEHSAATAAATATATATATAAALPPRSLSDGQSRPPVRASPDPTARRSASNTSLARVRTPEPLPLPLRPDGPGKPGIVRSYTGTLPLRRVERRASGDLRSVSLSQQQGQAPTTRPLWAARARASGDQGAISTTSSSASSSTSGSGSSARSITAGAAALGAVRFFPAATTTSSASATAPPASGTNSTPIPPIANEGRVRAKDMTDVYVSAHRSQSRP